MAVIKPQQFLPVVQQPQPPPSIAEMRKALEAKEISFKNKHHGRHLLF
jgi:hypothetical protein